MVNTLGYAKQKLTPQLTGSIQLRPTHASLRPPTPTLLGSNTQCGSVLAAEIDAYRRRIQTLLHFFDCIAQHWWDQLYPYKGDFIKRPSKSADETRSYQTRLAARINKFTMRTVVPGAAAIALMEAHARTKIFPASLLIPLSKDVNVNDLPSIAESGTVLLQKACSLARRIGDIEKLKQRLLLAALTWITSDGRDFNIRAQRLTMLVRHANPCLIEHFAGIRVLLTHYYRPRALVNEHDGDKSDDSQTAAPIRVEPITAARLTKSNEQIIGVIESVLPKQKRYLSMNTDFIPDVHLLGECKTADKQTEIYLQPGHSKEAEVPTQHTVHQSSNQLLILPSIVLNPLSLDTSELDWLSYEINRRDFNLHVLDVEEPEDEEEPIRKIRPVAPKPTEERSDSIISSTSLSNRPELKSLLDRSGLVPNRFPTGDSVQSRIQQRHGFSDYPWPPTTPIRSFHANELVSLGSSGADSSSPTLSLNSGPEEMLSAEGNLLSPHLTVNRTMPSVNSLINVNPYGEVGFYSGYSTPSWQSQLTSDSNTSLKTYRAMITNTGGQGELPLNLPRHVMKETYIREEEERARPHRQSIKGGKSELKPAISSQTRACLNSCDYEHNSIKRSDVSKREHTFA